MNVRLLLLCVLPLSGCSSPTCADFGESLSVTKAEVYGALSADADVPDAGSPCPTSQQISDYVSLRYGEWIAPVRIGTPRDDGDSCEYPVSDTACR